MAFFASTCSWLLRLSALVLVFAISISVEVAAFAATPEEEATAARLKTEGDAKRDELHYEEAIALYDKSYAIVPNPAILYNKARALEFIGEYPRALELLEEFSQKASPELKAKVNGLEKVIADVTARVATLRIVCNIEAAELRINGRIVGTLSATAETLLRVKSGQSKIEVIVDGYLPFQRDRLLAPRTENPLVVELQSRMTTGTLVVTTADGASIEVDGALLGKTSIETQLKAGNHSVRAVLTGFDTEERAVVIFANSRRELKFDKLRGTPITKRWWFWTAIGVVAVGGTVGIIAASKTERPPTEGSLGTLQTGLPF
jgi:hypothetical protein